MDEPLVRQLVRKRTAEIPPGRTLRNWNDLLWTYPGLIGVKTGPHRPGRLGRGRGRPAGPDDRLRRHPRQPLPRASETPT